MEEQFWKNIEGKWNDEPDFLELTEKGFHLVVLRSYMGNLNGYVGVKITSPLFLRGYDDKNLYGVHIHGGLTFAGSGILIPYLKNHYWYFGFDTTHIYDLVPQLVGLREVIPSLKELEEKHGAYRVQDTYRDLNYVSNEVNELCTQIMEIEKSLPKKAINHRRIYRKLHQIKLAR